MTTNFIEAWRAAIIEEVFKTGSMQLAWPVWKEVILKYLPKLEGRAVYELGDHFSEIFRSTSQKQENTTLKELQSAKSTAGTLLESLVVIYCNLCLVGRPALVIKKKENVMPRCITEALTVNYRSAQLDSELDVIGLVLPESVDYINEGNVTDRLLDYAGIGYTGMRLKAEIDRRIAKCFNEAFINVIQCKTNWNDNAQIPMLWDMVYSSALYNDAKRASGNQASVYIGVNDYRIREGHFSYSFMTIPTVKPEKIKPDSVAVIRVVNLSGGNYWGLPSKKGVANNIKEMLSKNYCSVGEPGIADSFNAFVSQEGGEDYVRKVFRLD